MSIYDQSELSERANADNYWQDKRPDRGVWIIPLAAIVLLGTSAAATILAGLTLF